MRSAFHIWAPHRKHSSETRGCSLNFRPRHCPLLKLSPATHVRKALFVKITIAIVSCTRQKETFAAEGEQ